MLVLAHSPSDCLCYFPLISNRLDLGPGGLHWVIEDTSVTQTGTYGTYTYPTTNSDKWNSGWEKGATGVWSVYVFPNRNVPVTQITSCAIVWPSGTNDAWGIEFQVCLATSTSTVFLTLNNDADYNWNPPERLVDVRLYATGNLMLTWDDRTGNAHGNVTVPNCAKVNEFQHIAIQKSASSHVMYVYLDGTLKITKALPVANELNNIGFMRLLKMDGTSIVREFVVRSVDPYPTVVYTPGATPNFTSAIGDTQRRWNSFML